MSKYQDSDWNFSSFDAAKRRLGAQGFHVISPADLDRFYEGWGETPPDGLVVTKEMRNRFIDRDIAAINECSHAYGLWDWEESTGARAEKAYAEWRGLEILYESK
jgi:hypothetical protein